MPRHYTLTTNHANLTPDAADMDPGNPFFTSAASGQQQTVELDLGDGRTASGFFQLSAGTATAYQVQLLGRIHPAHDWVIIAAPAANTEGIWALDLPPYLALNIVSSNGTLAAGIFH